MYISESIHLYPSFKNCLICGEGLKEKYRRSRTVKSLKGYLPLISHVHACKNEKCSNCQVVISPEEETLLAIKGYQFGLDVIIKIGQERYCAHKTWQEIHQNLRYNYSIRISEREIGYLEEAYLALSNIIAKDDKELISVFGKLTGLILAIDGIKPDDGHEVLYLIREIQSGRILCARVLTTNIKENLSQLLEEVIQLGFPILGVVSDKESSILEAVKNKLKGIPHQYCQYHFLKNLAIPLTEADMKLKKTSPFI